VVDLLPGTLPFFYFQLTWSKCLFKIWICHFACMLSLEPSPLRQWMRGISGLFLSDMHLQPV
jgi:hypothetical protein